MECKPARIIRDKRGKIVAVICRDGSLLDADQLSEQEKRLVERRMAFGL